MSENPTQATRLPEDLRISAPQVCDQIVAFVRREVDRLSKRGVVIGLSGGLDSSACAYLCVRALGPDRILALILPERDSDPLNVAHAQMVARELRLPVETIDLTPILAQIGVYRLVRPELAANRPAIEAGIRWLARLTRGRSAFSQALAYAYGERGRLWERVMRRFLWRYAGRTQAFVISKVRLRMLLLYHHAALNDYLVVGTTDKLEWSIGFYDKYGDAASDITLLRHLYKTQVRELARYLGVPQAIIDKPSSGDLAAGLPNEVAIGLTYEQLDAVLFGLAQGLPKQTIARRAGVSPSAIRAVQRAMRAASMREALPSHL